MPPASPGLLLPLALVAACVLPAAERPRSASPPPRTSGPRYDRWYGLHGNAAVQAGGADADYGGVAYVGWARGSLDPDRVRPVVERSPTWGAGLEVASSDCFDDSGCQARTSLAPAVRAGITWVDVPAYLGHVYLELAAPIAHEHGSGAVADGCGLRVSVGYSLLPLLIRGIFPSSESAILLAFFSHIEASVEVYRPRDRDLAWGPAIGLGFGF